MFDRFNTIPLLMNVCFISIILRLNLTSKDFRGLLNMRLIGENGTKKIFCPEKVVRPQRPNLEFALQTLTALYDQKI